MSTASLIRLITGEDLVAVVVEAIDDEDAPEPDMTYTLKKPMRILAQPDQQGRLQVALAPFPPFGDDSTKAITIRGSSIMFVTMPNKGLSDYYKQATAAQSGLIIPPQSGIKTLSI